MIKSMRVLVCRIVCLLFFFKQKTAYEMRISDWSSDVCSSDLDVRPWLAAADAVVAPLLLARGVQNKLLEAMAMARPVVASSAAATGIDASDGEHLLVAAGAEAQIGRASRRESVCQCV